MIAPKPPTPRNLSGIPKLTTLPSLLPARYERNFPWRLDRRSKAVREVAADLTNMWNDLGGIEALSTQERWIVEQVVFIHRQILAYNQAALAGKEPTMDAGMYINYANAMSSMLKTLGTTRRSSDVTGGIQNYLAKARTRG